MWSGCGLPGSFVTINVEQPKLLLMVPPATAVPLPAVTVGRLGVAWWGVVRLSGRMIGI